MTPGLYTTPTGQSSISTGRGQQAAQFSSAATLSPIDWSAVSPWRKEIADLLSTARSQPQTPSAAYPYGRYINQIIPGFDPWYSETVRTLARPGTTDEEAGVVVRAMIPRLMGYGSTYNLGHIFDPIIAMIGSLPAIVAAVDVSSNPVVSALNNAPWGWIVGSFIAGMAACSVFGGKTTPNGRRATMRRNSAKGEVQALKSIKKMLQAGWSEKRAIGAAQEYAWSGNWTEALELLKDPPVARRLLAKALGRRR
jgi:hypothetical protein